jgi:hypothetical protein
VSAQIEVEEVEATGRGLHFARRGGGADALFEVGGMGQGSDLRVRMTSAPAVALTLPARFARPSLSRGESDRKG